MTEIASIWATFRYTTKLCSRSKHKTLSKVIHERASEDENQPTTSSFITLDSLYGANHQNVQHNARLMTNRRLIKSHKHPRSVKKCSSVDDLTAYHFRSFLTEFTTKTKSKLISDVHLINYESPRKK